jgi:O-antigen ligase
MVWQDHLAQAQSRFVHYQASLDLFLQFPVTGVGLGEYGIHAVSGMLFAHTHNLILEILAEEGLVGFFLFLSFLWFAVGVGALWVIATSKYLGNNDSYKRRDLTVIASLRQDDKKTLI